MSVFQDVSNWLLGSYKVRTSQLSNQSLIQHMRLDIGSGTTESQLSASNPLPVSGSLTSSSYALRMDEGATKIQEGIKAQLEKLRRQWQEDEDNLIAAFLFDLI